MTTRINNRKQDYQIFVGGCPKEIQKDDLYQYFGQFGEIVKVTVIKDKLTKRFRGFCFVSFENQDALEKVLEHEKHTILNKLVEVKKAVSKKQIRQKLVSEKMKKVYFESKRLGLSKKTVKKYLAQFGRINDFRMYNDKNKTKLYGFVLYNSNESASRMLSRGTKQKIGDHEIECQIVLLKEDMSKILKENSLKKVKNNSKIKEQRKIELKGTPLKSRLGSSSQNSSDYFTLSNQKSYLEPSPYFPSFVMPRMNTPTLLTTTFLKKSIKETSIAKATNDKDSVHAIQQNSKLSNEQKMINSKIDLLQILSIYSGKDKESVEDGSTAFDQLQRYIPTTTLSEAEIFDFHSNFRETNSEHYPQRDLVSKQLHSINILLDEEDLGIASTKQILGDYKIENAINSCIITFESQQDDDFSQVDRRTRTQESHNNRTWTNANFVYETDPKKPKTMTHDGFSIIPIPDAHVDFNEFKVL